MQAGRKIAIIFIGLVFLTVFWFLSKSGQEANLISMVDKMNQENLQNLRKAVVTGQFYPADEKELGLMIDEYLREADSGMASGAPRVLVVPHAGYEFSGKVAGAGFKQLENSGFERVILIGRSHNYSFDYVVVDTHFGWQTPLGNIFLDKQFINELKKTKPSLVVDDEKPHQVEHSLEVMLPFLIRVLGKPERSDFPFGFKIVPLLFGDENQETVLKLGRSLAGVIDEKTVVIISSDLSHYPNYENANFLDKRTIDAILQGDPEGFSAKLRELEKLNKPNTLTLACAEPAIIVGLEIAKELGLKPKLLKYANSGDVMPETKDRVVGYAAIAFWQQPAANSQQPTELNKEEQKIALQIARKTIEMAFEKKDFQPEVEGIPVFREKRGVFVTLHKNGQLKGCIGNFEPDVGLAQNIKDMALSAAFNDPRFLPLEISELEDIEIEISVLSPMQKITDPDIIEVGKHGVYVKQGLRSGVFLPQVAVEQGWTKEEFLNNLCEHKAGLPKNCWQDGSVALYIFTAQVFNER